MKFFVAVIVILVMVSVASADDDVDRANAWLGRNGKQTVETSNMAPVQVHQATPEDENINKAMDWLNRHDDSKKPGTGQRGSRAVNDQIDLFMNFGGWISVDNKTANAGQYASAKLRYRPFRYSLFGQEAGAGVFVLGETGSGHSGQSDFHWSKVGAGISHKIYGQGWDNVTDLGWARQRDQGKNDKQTTDMVYLSNYTNVEQRRQDGNKLLPQTEIMLTANIPYSANRVSTKSGKTLGQALPANDKLTAGLDVRQSVYDFNFGEFRLTPGILFGGGMEASSAVGKIGPSVKLAAYNQDILIADIFAKIKSGVDGWRWYPNIFLNPYGAIKAYKASQITEPSPEDLEFRQEEK